MKEKRQCLQMAVTVASEAVEVLAAASRMSRSCWE